MGTCVCSCGAKYRFAVSSAGMQAKCKRCGAAIMLVEPSAGPPGGIPTPIIEVEGEETPPNLGYGPERGYGKAILWSLLFPASVNNLATFLTLWAVFGLLDCLPLGRFGIFYFIWMFWLAIHFWYVAFQVAVVENSASGQFRLPDVQVSGDILADLIDPVLRWYGSWFIVLAPAVGYAIVQANHGKNVIWNTWQALTIPQLVGVPGPVADPVLMTLSILGFFLWPIVFIVVVIGGFGYLWRVDQILHTLGNTFGAYLLTVLIAAAGCGAYVASETYLASSLSTILRSATVGTLAQGFVARALSTGIDIYAGIVVARVIGLYFFHFGHRFAWDWGQLDK